jgi:RimJ/RimL family protein N-acetyltransferase
MQFQLRPWNAGDLPSLMQYANNWEIAKYMADGFPHPYSKQDGEAFIQLASSQDPIHLMAIEVGGEACGGIGLHPQSDIHIRNAELGYWLAQPFWGQGIMTRAIREMVAYGFEHFDVDRIFARPFGSNIGSQKALEKAGFTLEGRFSRTIWKKDRYEDECIYAVRRAGC